MALPSNLDEITTNPGRPSARALKFIRKLRPLVRFAFRPTITGVENLPQEGPFMVVANHSGGMGLAELTSLATLYEEAFDQETPIAGFALPQGFEYEPVRSIHRMLGTVPSTYEHAYQAFDRGVSLLVFPGGDHETLRPVWQANKVDFAQRKGFLRIAKEAGVPVVPMGIKGGHITAPMLFRSKWLPWILVVPRVFGIKRWSISLLSLLGVGLLSLLPLPLWARALIIFFWMGSPLTLFPIIPSQIHFHIGEPIENDVLFGHEGAEEEVLQRAYDQVVGAVQAIVLRPASGADEGSPSR